MSTRFDELEQRLVELQKSFLPSPFDPTGLYEDSVYEHTKAYRVLAHAEFESFVEERVLEVVNKSFDSWKTSGKATTALIGLVAFHEVINPLPESFADFGTKKKHRDLATCIENAKNGYNYYVRRENHGIKIKNLIKLLVPVGLTESDFDSEWLTTTEAWATARGEVAHKTAKVQVKPDPQHELKTVTKILDGFRKIDATLEQK